MKRSSENSQPPRVLVIGNVNMDVVLETPRFPQPGENVSCIQLQILPGGKAANQSVAAARLGARVRLIACLGTDVLSEMAFQNLKKEDINLSSLVRHPTAHCGMAVVMIEGSGENRIISHPGANGNLTSHDIRSQRAAFEEADIVLLQFGIPKSTVEAALALAKEVGVPAILDPTPLAGWLPDNWADASVLLPNESEFAGICELLGAGSLSHEAAFKSWSARGLRGLVVKLGAEGCVYFEKGATKQALPALKELRVVDTTGAGDAFAGAFGTEWIRTRDMKKALEFAVIVSGLTTTRVGAQSGLPTLAEIAARKASR